MNQSFIVNSRATSATVTGLYGLTNYEVMVAGVTVIDGPSGFIHVRTEEGGKRTLNLEFETRKEVTLTLTIIK